MRAYHLILLSLCTGCLLETEPCGLDFVAQDGECVPKKVVPPFDLAADGQAPPETQDATVDFALILEPQVDAQLIIDARMPDSGLVGDEWSPYSIVLIVDRSVDDSARSTPATPGADIDSVEVYDPSENRIAAGSEIIDSRVNDPYDANIQTRPISALGVEDGQAVSLGTQGGFIRLEVSGDRPLIRGDALVVYELDDNRENEDVYEVFLCRGDSDGLAGCRSMGMGQTGKSTFQLE